MFKVKCQYIGSKRSGESFIWLSILFMFGFLDPLFLFLICNPFYTFFPAQIIELASA